LFFIS
jgi:hypothetical protein